MSVALAPTHLSVLAIAVLRPDTLPAAATVADVRAYFRGSEKAHMALVVDDHGRLLTTILRTELEGVEPATVAATSLGRLSGRTIDRDKTSVGLGAVMDEAGLRRLAVVDTHGRLLGLVCRKASRSGFCTDAGIAARRGGGNS